MEQFFGEELKDNFDEIHAMFPEARKRDTGMLLFLKKTIISNNSFYFSVFARQCYPRTIASVF